MLDKIENNRKMLPFYPVAKLAHNRKAEIIIENIVQNRNVI